MVETTSLLMTDTVIVPTLPPIGHSLAPALASQLRDYLQLLARSMKPNSLRALITDLLAFETFCLAENFPLLPTTQAAVRAYLRRRHQTGVKANTISRAFSHIGQIHEAMDLPNPCRHRFITAELKALRRHDAPTGQATALRFTDLQRWTEAIAHDTLPATLRNRALVWLGYDGLLRVSELIAVELSWLETQADGSALLYLPAAVNKNSEDAYLYVTPTTLTYLEAWCQSANIREGRLFRSWQLDGSLRPSLHASSANEIIQAVGRQLGLTGVSSHSLRIGADQDLMELGESLVAIMVAGRWKDSKMPAHYGRKVTAAQSAMARLAQKQGR